jgi:hypothetical protein
LSAHLPVKFILLHEGRNDDGIRNFFLDVFEAWTKVRLVAARTVCPGLAYLSRGTADPSIGACPIHPPSQVLLNPFQQPNEPVISPMFDTKVKAAARKHL